MTNPPIPARILALAALGCAGAAHASPLFSAYDTRKSGYVDRFLADGLR